MNKLAEAVGGLWRDITTGLEIRGHLRRQQNQPFMREYWEAEDIALEDFFAQLDNAELNMRIDALAKKGKGDKLSLLNARRMVYEFLAADTNFTNMKDSYDYRVGIRIYEELGKMGVAEQFKEIYGGQGFMPLRVIPEKPYFNE